MAKIAPASAPSLVFTGIPADQAGAFDAALVAAFGRPLTPRDYLRAPFASGRISAVRGAPVDPKRIPEQERWAYDNDISIAAIGAEPVKAGVISGHWWPANYGGPPLVALATEAAKGAQLKVGDPITLSILGRDIEARVAVLRRVDFGGFGATVPS